MIYKRACLGGAAALAMTSAATLAHGQPQPSGETTPAAGAQVEEVIVTARKIQENVQNIPVAVTALSGASLQRQNVREIRDLAGKAPNLTITQGSSDAGSMTIAMRGQAAPDLVLTNDPAVGLYVDGVLLPRGYGLRGNMVDVQRLEILRGPQGTLYGKNTTGGLINVITKDPGPQYGASADASWGNYNAFNFVGILNLPLSDNSGLRIVAQRGGHDPYGHDATGRGLDTSDSSYVRAKFKGDYGPLTVRAFADYQSDHLGGAIIKLAGLTPATATSPAGGLLTREAALELYGVANATTLAQASQVLQSYVGSPNGFWNTAGTSNTDENYYTRDAGIDLHYQLNSGLALRSITGWRTLAFRNPIDLDGTPFIGTNPNRAAKDEFVSEELQLLGGGEKLNWVAGTYLSKEHGAEYSTTLTLPEVLPTGFTGFNRTDGLVTSESASVFGQFNWRLAPKWSLTGGARYTTEKKGLITHNRIATAGGTTVSCNVPVSLRQDPAVCSAKLENTFSEPTWTASLTYAATDDINIYAKASRGFRSGGENYRGSVVVQSFAPFLPETVNEYEAGLKSELFDRTVRLNLATFYDKMNNVQRSVIIAVPSTGATATVETNAARAHIFGAEAEGTWRVTPRFTVDGGIGWIHPKYDAFRDFTGDRSGEDWPTPDVEYSADATYVIPTATGDLTTTVTWSGQSKQNLYPASKQKQQVTQPAYGLLSARLTWAFNDQNVEISLFGRNLLGKEYYVSAVGLESIGWNAVVAGDPRTYGVEVVKRFGGV